MSKEGDVRLIPDRKDYKAGDTAEILVQAPFYPAEGVLTVRRSGILKARTISHGETDDHLASADRGRLDS